MLTNNPSAVENKKRADRMTPRHEKCQNYKIHTLMNIYGMCESGIYCAEVLVLWCIWGDLRTYGAMHN